MIKKGLFYIVYLPLLAVVSLVAGVVSGFMGALIGAVEWYVDCLLKIKAGRRFPYRKRVNYFSSKIRSLLSAKEGNGGLYIQYAISLEKEEFEKGDLPVILLFKQIAAVSIAFIAFLVFYMIYGIFYKGPLLIFQDGIEMWERKR
jgi:hypothetical protein